MSWRALTEDDIKTGISGAELTALRSLASNAGLPDPVNGAITRVTAEVRGYVAGCKENSLGADGTIPLETLGAAIDLAVWYVITGVGMRSNSLTEQREKKKNDAATLLRSIARCELKIAQPEVKSTETIARPLLTVVTANKRNNTREQMKSL